VNPHTRCEGAQLRAHAGPVARLATLGSLARRLAKTVSHLEQRAEGELQELGQQNSSTSFDSAADDVGVLGRDDGGQGAAPRSQIMPVKVSTASVSSAHSSQRRPLHAA